MQGIEQCLWSVGLVAEWAGEHPHCSPPKLVVALVPSLYSRLQARSVLLSFNTAPLKVPYQTESLKEVISGTLWDNCCSRRICDYLFTDSVGMCSHLWDRAIGYDTSEFYFCLWLFMNF